MSDSSAFENQVTKTNHSPRIKFSEKYPKSEDIEVIAELGDYLQLAVDSGYWEDAEEELKAVLAEMNCPDFEQIRNEPMTEDEFDAVIMFLIDEYELMMDPDGEDIVDPTGEINTLFDLFKDWDDGSLNRGFLSQQLAAAMRDYVKHRGIIDRSVLNANFLKLQRIFSKMNPSLRKRAKEWSQKFNAVEQ